MKSYSNSRFILAAITFISICTWIACSEDKLNQNVVVGPTGSELATKYCTTCHLKPNPVDLDKETWRNHVLVRMGAYLGVYWVAANNNTFFDEIPEKWIEPGEGGERILEAGVYPDKPAMSREEWLKIVNFYIKNAPEKTTGFANQMPLADETPLFRANPLFHGSEYPSAVTAINIDEKQKRILAGFYKTDLVELNSKGVKTGTIGKVAGAVHINQSDNRFTVTDIGSMVGSDKPMGYVRSAESIKDYKNGNLSLSLFPLQRPVHANFADMDGDGDEDAVVCEFGRNLGALAYYENTGSDYVRKVLFNDDGPVVTHIRDFNNDGKPDIMALMANADEGIDVFVNEGGGEFLRKRLFRFDPTYGCAGLEIADMDGDGDEDLILCNGDNMDYPPILKANHGVRIFLQTDKMQYQEAMFLPLNGAYGVEVADFDGDGDNDIAAVSYFPDFSKRPQESFVYFENNPGLQFKASTIRESQDARWMIVDSGDLDGDGDIDLVLGAFNVQIADAGEERFQRWVKKDIPILFLENQSIN